MRSRLGDAARDVAEGKITLEEVTRAIIDAVRDHSSYSTMEEKDFNELNNETRARRQEKF